MNYDDQLDYEYAIHCLKIENNRLLRAVRRFEMSDNIDVGCVGCAGPCKVVDVSANLQKELDVCSNMNSSLHEELGAIMGQLTDSRKHCGYLSKIIDELKDQNFKDLKELYDLDAVEIAALKDRVAFDAKHIDRLNKVITSHTNEIRGLEAELSTRKKDSMVLKKVVDAITMWEVSSIESTRTVSDIQLFVRDYLNAPEGPPETPIDDGQDIAIVFTYGEIL